MGGWSTYLGQSVVHNTFGFPNVPETSQSVVVADMEVRMAADMEVDKVPTMWPRWWPTWRPTKKDWGYPIWQEEEGCAQHSERVGHGGWLISTRSLPDLHVFYALRVYWKFCERLDGWGQINLLHCIMISRKLSLFDTLLVLSLSEISKIQIDPFCRSLASHYHGVWWHFEKDGFHKNSRRAGKPIALIQVERRVDEFQGQSKIP